MILLLDSFLREAVVTKVSRVLDPYQVLGVPRQASEAEIRKAFRRLAAEHHPDRNPDRPSAKERFQQINAAYQVLIDPDY